MSTLRLTTISNQTGSASVPSDTVINGSAKAWVNFDGTGTVAIRASFNVSSITDGGIGTYTVNFTSALTDANYCVSLSSDTNASGGLNAFSAGAPTTSNVPVYTYGVAGGGAGAYRDTSRVYVAIFR